jgi:uncharacterized membrane protein
MNEQLTRLEERIEALSKNMEQYRSEIAALKTEIRMLKGEPAATAIPQPVFKKQVPVKTPVSFENFVGLTLIHFVGIIVLLIGLSIGVKYAIDAQLISPLLRIVLAYAAGILLLVVSMRVRKNYLVFSLILFSGAMASAYFTTYAAFEYYAIFPGGVAFGGMLLLTIFTVFNSLKYNRQEIAILGLAGAYAIPFFVSTNSGNIAGLFSYMLLINAGILIISFRKYWLALTMISFFTSWCIFITTMMTQSHTAHFITLNSFAFAFFFLFLFNCVVFKLLKKQTFNSSDTFVVIADTLFLYFTACTLYPAYYQTDISFITLAFAIAYCAGALITKKIQPLQMHLSNALFTLAFIALVLFVAMEFQGFTVTIIWVLMAVAVFIGGMIGKIKMLRMAAIGLFALTLVKLLLVDSNDFSEVEKIIAWIFTGGVLLAVSFLYQKFKQRIFEEMED